MRALAPISSVCALVLLLAGCGGGGGSSTPPPDPGAGVYTGSMVVLGVNDLGMHCMNQDFSELMILPPFNNLQAQVIRRGGEPSILRSGVSVGFTIPGNTHSADKTNFWTYSAGLLGLSPAPNVGLAGTGLSGAMLAQGNGVYLAEGIPITPLMDGGTENPYPLADITVTQAGTVTARTRAVVPVSWEISCDLCHNEPGKSTAQDILTTHDDLHGTDLTNQKPVACGHCHAQPPLAGLGLTGSPALPTLSRAMHGAHAPRMAPAGLSVECYACHPGIRTQCLRDVHASEGMDCEDCHGDMGAVSSPARQPWADEPRCGSCHTRSGYEFEQSGQLFRNSTGHSNVRCASCHGAPHATVPSQVAADNAQSVGLQGEAGPLKDCRVCHNGTPDEGFFHRVSED